LTMKFGNRPDLSEFLSTHGKTYINSETIINGIATWKIFSNVSSTVMFSRKLSRKLTIENIYLHEDVARRVPRKKKNAAVDKYVKGEPVDTYMLGCMYIHTYIYRCIFRYIYICWYVHIYTRIYTHVFFHIYIYILVCTYIHTYIYTCIFTYIYMCW